jgi:VIT1/CCC1 family predicted Fe2+/Mn2+ transporter
MSAPVEEWSAEMRAAWLYEVVARVERDGRKRELFESLARTARTQAAIWAEHARKNGAVTPSGYVPDQRARLVAWLVERLGPRRCRPLLAALKVRGLSVYAARAAPAEQGHVMPTSVDDFGSRHRTQGGGTLRAAVFGVSDGLVSNTSLILGIAGATADAHTIVVSGIAGLLAGACSMAAGEYVSMRSQRELYEYQIGLERAELAEYPAEEREELALIYAARGLSLERARELARSVMRDRESALDALAREELGLNPDDLGSPWRAALSSFLAFAAGALVPLAPFAWSSGRPAAIWAASIAALALFAVGAALSLFTGRSASWSGLRMVLIGAAAGCATWGIGTLFGVATS